jgi:hypothetical protein
MTPVRPELRRATSSSREAESAPMLFGDARERVEDILVALPKPDRKAVAPAPDAQRIGASAV